MKKEEHEQTINTEHYKDELCINFSRKYWWISGKNNQGIVNMNSKLLYAHLRHERKHNDKINWKNIHIGKKAQAVTWNNTRISEKMPTFGSAILLKQYYEYTKSPKTHEFQPFLHQISNYLYIAPRDDQ